MNDYSQSGEQTIILRYFGKHIGTFLDIGANDGITLNNTRALFEFGWSGVCVEPSPVAFQKLSSLYANDAARISTINAAIVEKSGQVDFWDCGVHLKKGDTSLLSTTKKETLARWKRSGEQFTKTTVRGITYGDLLKECGQSRFDFINIDAEGADWEILRQIDLREAHCDMLCVEVNGQDDKKFTDYAAQYGFRMFWSSFENRIYAK